MCAGLQMAKRSRQNMCQAQKISVIGNEEKRICDEIHDMIGIVFAITNDMLRKYEYLEGDDFGKVAQMSLDNGNSMVRWWQFLAVWNTVEFDQYRQAVQSRNIEVIVHEDVCNNNCILGIVANIKTNDSGDNCMTVTFKPILE